MSAEGEGPGRLADEAAFHDEWAGTEDPSAVAVRECFEGLMALENRFILGLLEPLGGRRVLDVGTGLGEAAAYFALRGATVTACDVSPGMVDFAGRVARSHGREIEGVVCPAERLALPDTSFDVVYAANLVHHLADLEPFLDEARRVLRPGGVLVTWDPIAYNPVINVYRWMADKVRSKGERPVRFSCLAAYRRRFRAVRHREFWLTTQALFLKYYLVDRLHPNQGRYWKLLLRERPGLRSSWLYPLLAADRVLLRLWPLNYLAWNTVIWANA